MTESANQPPSGGSGQPPAGGWQDPAQQQYGQQQYGQQQYGGYPAAPGGYGPPATRSSDDTVWALLAHLSFFVIGLIGPLIVMLTKGKESPFVRGHAVEALNFHISVLIAVLVSFVLVFLIIGFVLLPVVIIGAMVLTVIAAVAAGGGKPYRYPVNLRLVK